MKRKRNMAYALAFVSILYLFGFVLVTKASSTEEGFMLTDGYPINILDVNKPTIGKQVSPKYNETCVHAAVSNAMTSMLGWTQKDAYELYYEFFGAFGNRALAVFEAYKYVSDQVKHKTCEDAMDMQSRAYSVYFKHKGRMGWKIVGLLEAGNVLVVGTHQVHEGVDYWHVITVWGYKWVAGTLSICYTDSDDGVNGPVWGELMLHKSNEYWGIRLGSGMAKIHEIHAFQIKAGDTQ